MQIRNDKRRYGVVAQALHWLVALGFVALFALAYYMEDLPNTPYKIEVYNLHKSIGVTVLVLAVGRVIWRLTNPVPSMPSGRPRWEHLASNATHVALYVLIFAQPVSGLIFSLYSQYPSQIWGMTLPKPAADAAIEDAFKAVHFYLQWVILAIVGVHVAAALRHHFMLKDDVLRRMLPGAAAARRPLTQPGKGA